MNILEINDNQVPPPSISKDRTHDIQYLLMRGDGKDPFSLFNQKEALRRDAPQIITNRLNTHICYHIVSIAQKTGHSLPGFSASGSHQSAIQV